MSNENTGNQQARRRILPGAAPKKLSFEDLPEAVAAVLDELADLRADIQKLTGDSELLDAREACKYLSVSRTGLYKLIRNNNLPHARRGKSYVFRRAEIDNWMKRDLNTGEHEQ